MKRIEKVLYISNLPTSYFVDFCNILGKKVNLTVIFERNINLHNGEPCIRETNNLSFKAHFLSKRKNLNKENIFSIKILKFLLKKYDRIVFCNPCSPTGIVGEIFCRLFHKHYIVQSEGGFVYKEKGIKYNLKKFVMEKADFYLSGCDLKNNYFLSYGGNKDNIKKFNFSSFSAKDIISKLPSKIEKENVKKDLGLPNKFTILCVAQTIHRKGIDTLLTAIASLDSDVSLVIVGGNSNPELNKIIKKNNLANVRFIERTTKENVKKFYLASDIFVLLTREDIWGLVINEAFAHGLPTITTTSCNSGLQLIKDFENGFLVKKESPDEAAQKIKILIDNVELRKQMGSNNLLKIMDYTVESMANQIYNYLKI